MKLEPLTNPNKDKPGDTVLDRIYSRLKRIIDDREQFIDTVRYQEQEFKDLRLEIKSALKDRPAWWKGFASGVLVMAAMYGILIAILIIFR